jgi:uncharacterized membrane protein
MTMRHRIAFGLAALLAAFSTGTHQAHAGLHFCNASNVRISVAIGFTDSARGPVGQGWWVINAGECQEAITGALDSRYYYFYAMTPDGPSKKTYSGDTPFCLQSVRFKLNEAQYGKDSEADCTKAGLEFAKFVKVDVGNSKDHTIKFVGDDPQGGNASPTPPVAPPSGLSPRPPIAWPPRPPAPAPVAGTACQRYPNLC